MDDPEFLNAVSDIEASIAIQKVAGELVSLLTQPRVDYLNERIRAGHNRALLKFPLAAWLDQVDEVTGSATRRPDIYRFNRELGFSRVESLRHTSPSTAREAAALLLPKQAETS